MYKAYLAQANGKLPITEWESCYECMFIVRELRARKLGLPLPPLPSENAA
jgi:hypothetical protein